MLPYTATCHALQEGFQCEILKLENLQDKEMIKTITQNALAILEEIKKNGGENDQVDAVKKYIETQSEKALNGEPIQQGSNVKIETIEGDDHCFFRALGYGLHDHNRSNPHFLKGLNQKRNELLLKGPEGIAVVKDLDKLIEILPKGRDKPKELIGALRSLSCTWNEQFHQKGVGAKPKTYFRDMRLNAWGGGPEIDALMEVLEIQICTSHNEAVVCGYDNSRPIITLQHTGNHFNLVNRVDTVAKKCVYSSPILKRSVTRAIE